MTEEIKKKLLPCQLIMLKHYATDEVNIGGNKKSKFIRCMCTAHRVKRFGYLERSCDFEIGDIKHIKDIEDVLIVNLIDTTCTAQCDEYREFLKNHEEKTYYY